MKKSIIFLALFAMITNVTAQKTGKLGGSNGSSSSSTTKEKSLFSNEEAGNAIKELLTKGAANSVDIVGKPNGYFKNNLIKIPFPAEAKTVETKLRQVGAGKLADDVIESLNRAAEDAAKAAKPILVNSIKQLTVTDAINIVNGSQKDAATQFLKRSTTEQILTAFRPSIKSSLDKTQATKYWKKATKQYNRMPMVQKINTDLVDYTSRKALDGLFIMLAQEEEKIRANPQGFGSGVIDKVFGGLFGK